ncbi:hypothetical protein, partial [Plasmodium yoelii yoelii]
MYYMLLPCLTHCLTNLQRFLIPLVLTYSRNMNSNKKNILLKKMTKKLPQ